MNKIPSHQIIQLVNKNKFPGNCTLFKSSKLEAVSSICDRGSPGGNYGPVSQTGSAAGYLDDPREGQLQWLPSWAARAVPSPTPRGLELLWAFSRLTHKPQVSPVQMLPWVSRCSSISYAIGLEPEFFIYNFPLKTQRGQGPLLVLAGETIYLPPYFVPYREATKNVFSVYW